MNTCKRCKHWKIPDKDDYYANGLIEQRDPVTFDIIEPKFEMRVCKIPTQIFAERPPERDGFSLVDASGYYAVLATAEDFGCVKHEERDSDE